jgi:hypothetical protein
MQRTTIVNRKKKGTYVARVWIFAVTEQYIFTSQCTYLNIGSLEAPREYVLHGPLLATY